MSRNTYWRQSLEELLPDHGINLSAEALETLAKDVALAAEMYGEAMGLTVIPNPVDHFDLHAPLVRRQQGLGDWGGREAVGLHQDGRLRGIQFPDHGLGAAAARGEVDFDLRYGLLGKGLVARYETQAKDQEFSHFITVEILLLLSIDYH